MQRRWLILGLIAVLAVSAAATWNLVHTVKKASTPPPVAIGGPFNLVDHNAGPVTDADFRGRYLLVFFGYTYCPDVCPKAMQTIGVALDQLGKDAAKIRPLFISVDPERDTPEVLKSFVKNFHPSLTGLTGSPRQVQAAAKAYRVYYGKVKEDGGAKDEYLMNHSAGLYLMGADGKFITMFSHNTTPEDLAAKIRKYL
ncbi:MAG: SCO family protein [Proteobacteria bacterium]|nr:SCO family protein [Pseudomonadota bacterium]